MAQARTQLKSTQADLIDLIWQRAQFENAIAVLLGKAPANFALADSKSIPALPDIPVTLPSQLLERRPDIASAERNVMAANANIGVSRAAYFPDLSLSLSGGYSSSSFSNWIELPNRYWSVGPSLAMTLFDAGKRSAEVDRTVAVYDQTVAQYRQTVLDGFKEVENYLVQLKVYGDEAVVRQEALDAARESLRLTENQYRAGLIGYLDVVNVQTTALSNERSVLNLLQGRLVASVQLIAALGGGLNNLIAATADNSTGIGWGGFGTAVGPGAQSDTDGASNTAAVGATLGAGVYAAQLCSTYQVDSQGNTPCQAGNTCYNDWFLPARNQLAALYTNRVAVGGFANALYWSSTESSASPLTDAWINDFSIGNPVTIPKTQNLQTRCVRVFTP